MIPVNKTFLPDKSEYLKYLDQIWESNWLTNNGPLLLQLEQKLKEKFNVPNLHYTSNGTIAIQIALKALGSIGEIITTPFSYVATTNAILWEGALPVFADLEEESFFPGAKNIENLITENTKAILLTHVYGLNGNTAEVIEIGKRYNIPVIFDSAHSYGVTLNNRALSSYGDCSTMSFHATKLFHTVEGGAIITANQEWADKIQLMRSFGHVKDEYFSLGVNGKNSEFHAAMGLCMLEKVPGLITERKVLFDCYQHSLKGEVQTINLSAYPGLDWNYSYFPVVFKTPEEMKKCYEAMFSNKIYPRRYFYPSLNRVPFFKGNPCPVSENLVERVLALPFYNGLEESQIEFISKIVLDNLE